jgi:hypothetical protein
MELERLREKLRQLARRELMHGSAMLVGGRKSRRKSSRGSALLVGGKSRRKSTRGSAMLAGKRRKSSRGSALLVGGKSRRKSTRGSAMLAGKRRKSTRGSGFFWDPSSVAHSLGNSGISAENSLANMFHRKASGRRHKTRRGNAKGTNALKEINHIARQLKAKNPRLEHTEAISQASAIYRNQ